MLMYEGLLALTNLCLVSTDIRQIVFSFRRDVSDCGVCAKHSQTVPRQVTCITNETQGHGVDILYKCLYDPNERIRIAALECFNNLCMGEDCYPKLKNKFESIVGIAGATCRSQVPRARSAACALLAQLSFACLDSALHLSICPRIESVCEIAQVGGERDAGIQQRALCVLAGVAFALHDRLGAWGAEGNASVASGTTVATVECTGHQKELYVRFVQVMKSNADGTESILCHLSDDAETWIRGYVLQSTGGFDD